MATAAAGESKHDDAGEGNDTLALRVLDPVSGTVTAHTPTRKSKHSLTIVLCFPNLATPAASCPVESVTVYCDRAEVTRAMLLTDVPVGPAQVMLTGLPEVADSDSIRVEGTGHVTLTEVTNPSAQQSSSHRYGDC